MKERFIENGIEYLRPDFYANNLEKVSVIIASVIWKCVAKILKLAGWDSRYFFKHTTEIVNI